MNKEQKYKIGDTVVWTEAVKPIHTGPLRVAGIQTQFGKPHYVLQQLEGEGYTFFIPVDKADDVEYYEQVKGKKATSMKDLEVGNVIYCDCEHGHSNEFTVLGKLGDLVFLSDPGNPKVAGHAFTVDELEENFSLTPGVKASSDDSKKEASNDGRETEPEYNVGDTVRCIPLDGPLDELSAGAGYEEGREFVVAHVKAPNMLVDRFCYFDESQRDGVYGSGLELVKRGNPKDVKKIDTSKAPFQVGDKVEIISNEIYGGDGFASAMVRLEHGATHAVGDIYTVARINRDPNGRKGREWMFYTSAHGNEHYSEEELRRAGEDSGKAEPKAKKAPRKAAAPNPKKAPFKKGDTVKIVSNNLYESPEFQILTKMTGVPVTLKTGDTFAVDSVAWEEGANDWAIRPKEYSKNGALWFPSELELVKKARANKKAQAK